MSDIANTGKQKKRLYMGVSIQGHWSDIQIGKDVIRALGEPSHICLRVNDANHSLALCPCDAAEVLSFKIPVDFLTDPQKKFRIHSTQFVKDLLQANQLDAEKTYSLTGTYSEKINAVVFSFDEVVREG